jgi:hypothetical protein
MAACVASLLELPLVEMPIVLAADQFNNTWDAWLRARGLARICFHSNGTNFAPKGYHLLAGPSPRPIVDENGARAFHVVVGLDGVPVHDPHPDGTFLEKITEVEIIYPLDPAMIGVQR